MLIKKRASTGSGKVSGYQLGHRRRDFTEADRGPHQRHGRPDDFRCAAGGQDADGGAPPTSKTSTAYRRHSPTSGSGIATDNTETDVGTNSTYTVSSSDVDSTIRVDVSFTDLAGNSEGPLPSEATAAVVPAAPPCPAGNDWCATMTVGTFEAGGTFYGFFFVGSYGQLDEPTIDYGHSFEVEEISIYEPESLDSADRITSSSTPTCRSARCSIWAGRSSRRTPAAEPAQGSIFGAAPRTSPGSMARKSG